MSGTLPAHEPACAQLEHEAIDLLVSARPRDLGGFAVRRILPAIKRRMVGPFIFFDHMGPASLPPGIGFDVRPHPHIALATLTYLFEGEIVHRDSLGSVQTIRPGDVNWMVAGRGIVHSERCTDAGRSGQLNVHGIQCWVALPSADEETAPRFEHHPHATIPTRSAPGVRLDIIAGTAWGERSPVGVLSPTLYAHALFDVSARLELPDEHEQRAVYVVEGHLRAAGRDIHAGTLAIFRPGARVYLCAVAPSRVMILGGQQLLGERHMWWNFVSSRPERIEQAKQDWREQRFPTIPGDDREFIPLPEQ